MAPSASLAKTLETPTLRASWRILPVANRPMVAPIISTAMGTAHRPSISIVTTKI